MTELEQLFSACSLVAMIGWLLLVVVPHYRAPQLVAAVVIPLLLATVYLVLIATNVFGAEGGFGSLREVARCEQRLVRTIASPNPDQRNGCLAQEPSIDEVLILADDDGVLRSRVLPDDGIIGSLQADVEYVRGLMASAGNPVRQPWR